MFKFFKKEVEKLYLDKDKLKAQEMFLKIRDDVRYLSPANVSILYNKMQKDYQKVFKQLESFSKLNQQQNLKPKKVRAFVINAKGQLVNKNRLKEFKKVFKTDIDIKGSANE